MTALPETFVSERLLERPAVLIPEPRLDDGLRRLLTAITAQRHLDDPIRSATPDLPVEVLTSQLAQALAGGHEVTAASFASLLKAQVGLLGLHEALAKALAQPDGVLRTRTAARTAATVLHRLHPGEDLPAGQRLVVVATPPGDAHDLAAVALGHLLSESGHPALVVGDLPLDVLAELVSERDVQAVVLSAHLPLPEVVARRYCTTLRAVSPDLLVVLGGPGVTPVRRGPDLVTSDARVLLDALDNQANVLTQRECQVLRDVAEGLTNAEIAGHLGMSPATVKTHLDRVYSKTGTEHRAAAVARALRQGWIG
jgi:DNA-binding CsgD family transcriptional regulator